MSDHEESRPLDAMRDAVGALAVRLLSPWRPHRDRAGVRYPTSIKWPSANRLPDGAACANCGCPRADHYGRCATDESCANCVGCPYYLTTAWP